MEWSIVRVRVCGQGQWSVVRVRVSGQASSGELTSPCSRATTTMCASCCASTTVVKLISHCVGAALPAGIMSWKRPPVPGEG